MIGSMIAADGAQMEVELAGPGDFAVDVVGVSQYQSVLAAAAAGGKEGRAIVVDATLMLEDDNPYDNQAVAVHIDGKRCGYLSRENARLYRADLAAAGQPRLIVRGKAKVVGGFETKRGERAHFGLKLDLPRLLG
jgi:hypothetical protein